jgi:hypothetical protein
MSDFLMVAGQTGPNDYFYNPCILSRSCEALAKEFANDPPLNICKLATYQRTLELLYQSTIPNVRRHEVKMSANDILVICEFFTLFARSFLIAARTDESLPEPLMLPEMSESLGAWFLPMVQTGGKDPLQRTFESTFTEEEKNWLESLLRTSPGSRSNHLELSCLFKRALVIFHVQMVRYQTIGISIKSIKTPPSTWDYLDRSVRGYTQKLLAELEANPVESEYIRLEQKLFNQAILWSSLRRCFPDFARRFLV